VGERSGPVPERLCTRSGSQPPVGFWISPPSDTTNLRLGKPHLVQCDIEHRRSHNLNLKMVGKNGYSLDQFIDQDPPLLVA
jgi:hypothetical protein